MVKSIGPDHEIAGTDTASPSKESHGRAWRAARPGLRARPRTPNTPIFLGSIRNPATSAGWRNHRITGTYVVDRKAGYGCSGTSR